MHPIICKIGPVVIYSYGLILALAFLACTFLIKKEAEKQGFRGGEVVDLSLYLVISGIIGARFLYVLINFEDYLKNPFEIIMLSHGGLVFYGGLILATITGIWFLKKRHLPVLKIGDIVLPYLALGQAIGRLGCLLNGCCYGKLTNLPWGIRFPGHIERVHPTQIYESIFLLCIFVILKFLQNKFHKPGQLSIFYFLLYSLGRFLVEFYRGDNPHIFLALTFSQLISIILFIISLLLLMFRPKDYEKL